MAAKQFFSSALLRFSIRQLFVWTALVALACVALRNASPIWVASLLSLTLLVLTVAVPLAIFRNERSRAFWIGFALFGWIYALVLGYSWSLDPGKSDHNPLRPERLVTARLTSSGFERIYGAPDDSHSASVARALAFVDFSDGTRVNINNTDTATLSLLIAAGQTVQTEPYHDDFVNVAHAFWAILLAAIGGWFTRWIYATRPVPRSEPAEQT
jgi:hypothetical protein